MLLKARVETEKRQKPRKRSLVFISRGNGVRNVNRVGKVRTAYQRESKRGQVERAHRSWETLLHMVGCGDTGVGKEPVLRFSD